MTATSLSVCNGIPSKMPPTCGLSRPSSPRPGNVARFINFSSKAGILLCYHRWSYGRCCISRKAGTVNGGPVCLVVRVDVDGQLLVSAAQILDECVPGTDHSRRSRFRPHIGRNRVFAPVRCQKAKQVG